MNCKLWFFGLLLAAAALLPGTAQAQARADSEFDRSLQQVFRGTGLDCILYPGDCNSTGRRPSRNTGRGHAPAGDPQVRADQEVLNFFEFDAGGADGIIGRRTRAAIKTYQQFLGYPQTGKLTSAQRSVLNQAKAWVESGQAAGYGNNSRRQLLQIYLQPGTASEDAARRAQLQFSEPPPVTNPTPAPSERIAANTAPGATTQTGGPGAFPVIGGAARASVADYCESVRLLDEASPVSLTPLGQPQDMARVLDKEFCDAREYTMAVSQNLLSSTALADTQIEQSCVQVVAFLKPYVPELGNVPRSKVMRGMERAVRALGTSLENARQTGRVCLGFGYRKDNVEISLYATALLAGTGLPPYEELLGHHSRIGLGVPRNEEIARDWYQAAFSALESGVPPEILPGQSRRRIAAMRDALAGVNQAGLARPNTLPVLGLGNN